MADPSVPLPHVRDDQREAEILSQHLHPQFTGSLHEESPLQARAAAEASSSSDTPEQQSSLKLLGGDVHRDLYRLEAKAKQSLQERRAASFSYPVRPPDDAIEEGVAAMEPGSFRRHFVQQKKGWASDALVARSFLDFLDLYGSFAGEDLAETEDESAIATEDLEHEPERRPLLGRRRTTRAPRPGDASQVKTFFTLLKAFIGTGIIFLPKAFLNGGILFSSVALVTVAAVTSLCFHLLLECRKGHGGGYGDIGERIAGPRFRWLILGSITISQLGFVCTGIIFTADNVRAFLSAVAENSKNVLSTNILIALQLAVLVPLAFIRNISKLGPAALLADVFILMGLAYIYYYDIATIASRHGLESSVQLFNPKSFTLTIGSCIFTFEGIGLILPIQSSMKHPEKFDRLLYTVMIIITVLFTAVGALSYGAFGSDTKIEVINNLPQGDKFVNAMQFLYSMAILIGVPVQLFPAVRIMEGKLFGQVSGKRDPSIKWKKNIFRSLIVLACAVMSAVGAADLDKFVSLIGSFACVPLVYIYPAYLHWKGVADSPLAKFGDLTMVVLGFVFMIYTTLSTVSVWIQGNQ
ncbi:vacuolar amino acid transporter 3 [Aspergillus udagawae]|uniref:Vacuolar amino acid transporter 3 n=1 Tax=Aspergillus udagawae TaxID=91492 RepID=A0ABQ1B8B9_9EURO|nr:vacuolar amino acid transporter 3 [Aspergillus udagawae]GFF95919.1 vacuolar amino acid transporter 3 [Aspergillus udagawae]GFG14188.1 vacuolar amino acid transporter 3 [Aspergillus udagawae]GFG28089.1 vacuolar amino acid transporter 3 [Aspergillus udagawae]